MSLLVRLLRSLRGRRGLPSRPSRGGRVFGCCGCWAPWTIVGAVARTFSWVVASVFDCDGLDPGSGVASSESRGVAAGD